MAKFGLTSNSGFAPAPAGRQPAVLAEVSFAMVENKFENKGEELKMFWSFQLEAVNGEGERYVLDVENYPNITPTNKVGKLCRSWSGRTEALTQDQVNQWIAHFMGKLVKRDAEGNILTDDKGHAVTEDFDTLADFLAAIDPDPPAVGMACILDVVHKESATTKRDYALVNNIFPNAQVDSLGNIVRDPDTKKPVKAFQLAIENYVPRAQRQEEIKRRIAEAAAKKTGGGSKPAASGAVSKPAKDDVIPF